MFALFCGGVLHVCGDVVHVCGDVVHVCGDVVHVCGGVMHVCGDVCPFATKFTHFAAMVTPFAMKRRIFANIVAQGQTRRSTPTRAHGYGGCKIRHWVDRIGGRCGQRPYDVCFAKWLKIR